MDSMTFSWWKLFLFGQWAKEIHQLVMLSIKSIGMWIFISNYFDKNNECKTLIMSWMKYYLFAFIWMLREWLLNHIPVRKGQPKIHSMLMSYLSAHNPVTSICLFVLYENIIFFLQTNNIFKGVPFTKDKNFGDMHLCLI